MSDFKSSILQELQWRGFIQQMTHEGLDEALSEGALALYCGFDPTGHSLHVGHLLAVLGLAFFKRHGHLPVALVGGATEMIGDPSGKSEERNLLSEELIGDNVASIRGQLQAILERAGELHPETLGEDAEKANNLAPVVTTAVCLKPWSVIDFLRDVGTH